MATSFAKMLDKMQLQHIILAAQGLELTEVDRLDFDQREEAAYQALENTLRDLIPEENLTQAINAAMQYGIDRENIMMAVGMKMGARLQLQLLLDPNMDLLTL